MAEFVLHVPDANFLPIGCTANQTLEKMVVSEDTWASQIDRKLRFRVSSLQRIIAPKTIDNG